jgi:hypothetical protein
MKPNCFLAAGLRTESVLVFLRRESPSTIAKVVVGDLVVVVVVVVVGGGGREMKSEYNTCKEK